MRRTIDMFRTIRGTEVLVCARDFESDPSVGLSLGPETVFAVDHDGKDFELTDDEVEKLGIEATEAYLDDSDD